MYHNMIMNQYHQFFSQKLDRFDSHYKQFICLFISVLSVEELFRAIAEEKGLNVVKVLRENSSGKEIKVLDFIRYKVGEGV